MEAVIIIYFFFTGVTYASSCQNTEEDSIWGNLPVITMAFINGWYIIPALLGRIIRQKFEDSEEATKGEKE